VGHSYGGAVAVKLALKLGDRVHSLSVFEPVLFRLLLDAMPHDPATIECVAVAGSIRASLERDDADAAARTFYEYWSGSGAWSRLDDASRRTIAGRMPAIMACFDSLFRDDTSPEALRGLDVPTLVMRGGLSPVAGRTTAAFLAEQLPLSRRKEFESMGHMGPVTDAEAVNAQIERLILRSASPGPRFATERLGPAWRDALRPA
jgi:pimeloyl-ACP methyl ester carboxylesterase